jgi:hypothetical protein
MLLEYLFFGDSREDMFLELEVVGLDLMMGLELLYWEELVFPCFDLSRGYIQGYRIDHKI